MNTEKSLLDAKGNGVLADVSGQLPPLVEKLIGEHNLRVNLGVKEAGLHKWVIQTIKKFYPQTEDSFAE